MHPVPERLLPYGHVTAGLSIWQAPAGAPAGVTVTGTLPSPVKVAQNSSVTLATEAQGLQVCSDPRWKHTAWTAGAFGGNTIVTNDLKIYPEWTRYYQVTYSPQPPSGTVPGYPRSEIVRREVA